MPGILSKVGSFVATSPFDDQSVTGVGFQPKALIFYGDDRVTDGGAVNYQMAFGLISSVAQQVAVNVWGQDAIGDGVQWRARSVGECYFKISSTVPDVDSGEITALNADGFSIFWSVSPLTRIHYLALGGGNLSTLQGKTLVPTATGLQSVTGVGFRPDVVLFMTPWMNQADATVVAGMELCVGVMEATGTQGVMAYAGFGSIGDNRSLQLTTACLARLIKASSTEIYRAAFSSMDADGFTLDWTTVGQSTTNEYFWLALKGLKVMVSTILQPGGAGNQATTGIGFASLFNLFASRGDVSATTKNTVAKTMFGMGQSASARGVVWAGGD